MYQQTFAEVTFEQYRKPTRREWFLEEMNRMVPWTHLVAVIEPVYPKAEGPGRPPVGDSPQNDPAPTNFQQSTCIDPVRNRVLRANVNKSAIT